MTGSGNLALAQSNNYTGGTIINQVTLVIQSGSLGTSPVTPTTNITINNGATLRFTASNITVANTRLITLGPGGGTIDTQSNTETIAGVISGTGSLTKFGTGTLAVTATNTYSGGTTISGRLNIEV